MGGLARSARAGPAAGSVIRTTHARPRRRRGHRRLYLERLPAPGRGHPAGAAGDRVGSLPLGWGRVRMRTLLRTLQDYDPGFLRIIAELWGVDLPSLPAPQTAEALAAAMLEPGAARDLLEGLPPPPQRTIT